jgi:MFS family permease
VLLIGGNWRLLSGVVILDRIGKGIRTPPRDAMIAASSAPEQLATAFGVHRAMDTAGAMVGPLLAAALLALTAGAYDAVFVVSFCIALIGVAVITLFVDNPAQAPAEQRNPLPLQSIAELMRMDKFRRLLISGPLLALMTISDTLLYLTLQRHTALNDRFFPLLYVATALIFMLLAVPVGRLADRLGRGRIFLIGYALLGVGYGLLLTPLTVWVVVGGVLLLLGLYYAATDGVLMALVSETLPADRRTTGIALLTTGTGLARLAASSLYGVLWGWRGANTALLLFLVGLATAVGVTILMLHRLDKEKAEPGHWAGNLVERNRKRR